MLDVLLKNYRGNLTIDNRAYNSVTALVSDLNKFPDHLVITLNPNAVEAEIKAPEAKVQEAEITDMVYRIKVRQYMTKPASPEFDFQDQWNKGIPMPLRIMVGRKLKETKGMVQMELWGDILEGQATHCMKCGRVLTNDVSKYFGIGPECGGHSYTNPFETEEDLKAAVKEVRQSLVETRWTGWIIKSAIEEETLLENYKG